MNVIASPAPTSTRATTAVGHVGGQREHQLAGGHGERAGQDHPPRAEPVQRHADRHLQRGVDGQLQHEEQRDRRRARRRTAPAPRPRRPRARRGGTPRPRRRPAPPAPRPVGAAPDGRTAGARGSVGMVTSRMTSSRRDTFRVRPVSSVTGPGSAHYSRADAQPRGSRRRPRGGRRASAGAASSGRWPSSMAEKGYQATTIADIARAGRVSKTIVYAHFRDKEQCLLELYTRSTDHVLETVRRAQDEARRAGLPWRDRLRSVIGAYLDGAGRRPRGRLGGAGRGAGRRAPGARPAPRRHRPLRGPDHRVRRRARRRAPRGGPHRAPASRRRGGRRHQRADPRPGRTGRGGAARSTTPMSPPTVVIGLLERR